MSQPTAPETLGSLTDETQSTPNSKTAKAITGKSPMQIALGRLRARQDRGVCAVVILFFVAGRRLRRR